MDELKAKLKAMKNPFKATGSSGVFGGSKTFTGKANTLGGASPQAAAGGRGQGSGATAGPSARPPPASRPTPPSATAVAAPAVQLHQPTPRPEPLPTPTAATPQQPDWALPPPQQPEALLLLPPPSEALHLAASQLAADPEGPAAAEVLHRLLRNIVGQPVEPKFRRVRLSNPRIQSAVVDVSGGIELLLACGFEVVFEEGDKEGGQTEGYAVLAESAELEPLQQALQLLAPLLPPTQQPSSGSGAAAAASWQAAPSSSGAAGADQPSTAATRATASPAKPADERQWDEPRERNTQVLLPKHVERDVPGWFFERTGQDLRAAFLAAAKRQDQEKVLMTKAMREQLQVGRPSRPAKAFATIKVRLPEGLALQGEFNAGEPLAAVFAWVADCLSDPLNTYELVLPSRQALTPAPRSLRQADLLPSVALNFRWTGHSAEAMRAAPALRGDLLQAAQPAPVTY